MKISRRLIFTDFFPQEEKKEAIEYLKGVSKNVLMDIIGFFYFSKLQYYNFFTNPIIQQWVNKKVQENSKENEERHLIEDLNVLEFQELILSNKDILFYTNTLNKNIDRDEINIFKSFLVINEIFDYKEEKVIPKNDEKGNLIEQWIDMVIANRFPLADFNLFTNILPEINKLSFVTIYKFNKLVKFLQTSDEYQYLLQTIYNRFKQNSVNGLKKQVVGLIMQTSSYINNKAKEFYVEDKDQITFLDTLISNKIEKETDFLSLRENPLFKKDENTYVVINPFFVFDKFTKGIKFLLKNNYKGENFFSWYNKTFSEQFLMRNLLNSIFNKKYFIKKKEYIKEKDREPDYYIRNNEVIYLFEYKDILIDKQTRTSMDIQKIKEVLKKRLLLKDNEKEVGIGQLVKHIRLISEGNFEYDTEFSKEPSKTYTIYPILLMADRSLEVMGLNYLLNQWFREELKNKIPNISPKLVIKDLVFMDIDTMIDRQFYFSENNNFKNEIDNYIEKMRDEIDSLEKTDGVLLPFSHYMISKGITSNEKKKIKNFMFSELEDIIE